MKKKVDKNVAEMTVAEATEQGLISLIPVDFDDPDKRQQYTFGSGAVLGKTIVNLADALSSTDKPYIKAMKVANSGYAISEILGGVVAAHDEIMSSKGSSKNSKIELLDDISSLKAELDELKKKMSK